MDLLTNYGSDEEDDEPAVLRSSSGNNRGLCLPYPKASAPPPSDFFEKTSEVSRGGTSPKVSEKPSSLFLKLPPPSSTVLSIASLPPPSKSKKTRVVKFKPPVNLSVLESHDEDEEERRKKRSKVSDENKSGSGAKATGLAALLPPPKNSLGSGLAFGGGGAGGRRTAMETASVASKSAEDVNLPRRSIGCREGDSAGWQTTVSSSETQIRVNPKSQYHYSAQPGQGDNTPNPSFSEPEVRIPDGNYAQEKYHTDAGYQNGACQDSNGDDGYQNRAQQGDTSWQHPHAYGGAAEPSSANYVSDPLAEVLQRERRKGRNEPPPHFIEVKQTDLTAGRVREDQLRTTGIAFGPNYQPVSAGKDKPSKIHRRKHQIGALYFDMKSKEMELLDRRSKGNLTKAETQAKYGW